MDIGFSFLAVLVIPLLLFSLVMVVLSLPLGSLRLGLTDQGSNPAGSTTREGYDLLADGFGVVGVDGLKIEPLSPELLARIRAAISGFVDLERRQYRGRVDLPALVPRPRTAQHHPSRPLLRAQHTGERQRVRPLRHRLEPGLRGHR